MQVNIPNDTDLLAFTQSVRLRVVNNLTADGQVPVDPKEIKALATVLKDIDGQVQTKQRLQQDNQNAQADRDTAIALQRLSETVSRGFNGNPFHKDAAGNGGGNAAELPKIALVPGQTDVGASQDSYREFMSVHGVKDE